MRKRARRRSRTNALLERIIKLRTPFHTMHAQPDALHCLRALSDMIHFISIHLPYISYFPLLIAGIVPASI